MVRYIGSAIATVAMYMIIQGCGGNNEAAFGFSLLLGVFAYGIIGEQ